MELRAPDRSEAVGDLAEDRTPAQRLLRTVVGWGSLRLDEKDEQPVLPPDQAAAELLGDHVAHDRRREHLREREEVAPEEGLEHTRTVAAHQALAVAPDADGAGPQREHPPPQHVVAAVERILGIAEDVSETSLVLFTPAGLRAQPVRDPDARPHAAEEARDNVLVAPGFDDEESSFGVRNHPQPPMGLARSKPRLARADRCPGQQPTADR